MLSKDNQPIITIEKRLIQGAVVFIAAYAGREGVGKTVDLALFELEVRLFAEGIRPPTNPRLSYL